LTEIVMVEDSTENSPATVLPLATQLPATQSLTGRTEDNTPVHFNGAGINPGDLVEVRITEAKTFFLIGGTNVRIL